jgi:hypothetical protein
MPSAGYQDDVVFVALVLAGLLTLAFVSSLREAARHPEGFRRLYDEVPWRRIQVVVWAITLAALLGAWLGSANETVLSVIALAGFVLGWVCARFAASAAMNRRLRDFIGR